jgi:hypothetical protein
VVRVFRLAKHIGQLTQDIKILSSKGVQLGAWWHFEKIMADREDCLQIWLELVLCYIN